MLSRTFYWECLNFETIFFEKLLKNSRHSKININGKIQFLTIIVHSRMREIVRFCCCRQMVSIQSCGQNSSLSQKEILHPVRLLAYAKLVTSHIYGHTFSLHFASMDVHQDVSNDYCELKEE